MVRAIQYSDIDLRMTVDASGNLVRKTNEDAIKQGIKVCVLYNPDEVPFNKSFLGSRIYDYLFEPLNIEIAYEIKDEIEAAIRNNSDRITDMQVTVRLNVNQDAYEVYIYFVPANGLEPVETELILRRVA